MHAYHWLQLVKRYACIPQVTTSSISNTCEDDMIEGTNNLEADYHTEGTNHKTDKTMKDTLFPYLFLKNKFDKFHVLNLMLRVETDEKNV